jgi:hypothetical protein
MSKMKAEQYWEWRTTIEEMEHSKTKLKNVRLEMALMERNVEILKLRNNMYKEVVRNQEFEHKRIVDEYGKFIEKLEKEIGCSIRDKIIDPVTFQIMDENDVKLPE